MAVPHFGCGSAALSYYRMEPSFATPDPMKVFFVGDNRAAVNWGRAASIALSQLLSGSFDISGRVPGDFFDLSTAEAGYVGTMMPPRYYRHFRYLLRRQWRRPIAWYIRLEQLFGAKDFIAEDPAVSIDNLLAHKHRHPALDRIYDQAAEADLMVLDGDGDIIFSTPPRRHDSLPAGDDRTGHSPEKAGFSREFDDFGLSADRKKSTHTGGGQAIVRAMPGRDIARP